MPTSHQQQLSLKIKQELIGVLYKNYPVSFLSVVVISGVIFWQLSGYEKYDSLRVWFALLYLTLGIRYALMIWYNNTREDLNKYNLHYSLFLIGTTLTAIFLGMLGSFLMPSDLVNQTFILIIIGSVLGGAVQSLGADYKVCTSYILITLVPVLVWVTWQSLSGAKIYVSLLILMFIYCVFLIVIGNRYYEILVNNIKFRLQNAELLDDLKNNIREIQFFRDLERDLSRVQTQDETFSIAMAFFNHFMPKISGGIFIESQVKGRLSGVSCWGDPDLVPQFFNKKDCLAWSNRRAHFSLKNKPCKHHHENLGRWLCVPLQTPGKIFGILLLVTGDKRQLTIEKCDHIKRVANDITAALTRLELKENLENQATHDFLTGLYNKRYLQDYLKMEVNRVRRKNSNIIVLMLDIDHFKNVNDTYGHEIGDEILKRIGEFLKNNTRGYDVPCRFGGEEFIIIMPETSLNVAFDRAEFLRQGVKSLSVPYQDKEVTNVSISGGVASFPEHGETIEIVIEMADKALYQAKQNGRDQVCIANDKL